MISIAFFIISLACNTGPQTISGECFVDETLWRDPKIGYPDNISSNVIYYSPSLEKFLKEAEDKKYVITPSGEDPRITIKPRTKLNNRISSYYKDYYCVPNEFYFARQHGEVALPLGKTTRVVGTWELTYRK